METKQNMPNPCPRCGNTGLGDVIPPKINRGECYGPQGTKWKTHIGIEDPMIYDGVGWWQCGTCRYIWKRFSWIPTDVPMGYVNQ